MKPRYGYIAFVGLSFRLWSNYYLYSYFARAIALSLSFPLSSLFLVCTNQFQIRMPTHEVFVRKRPRTKYTKINAYEIPRSWADDVFTQFYPYPNRYGNNFDTNGADLVCMDMDKTDFIHIHMDGGVILAQPASIWSMWTWIKFYPYPHQ